MTKTFELNSLEQSIINKLRNESKPDLLKSKITATSDSLDLKIYWNEILHLYIDKRKLTGIQSWYINENDLKIELYTTTGDILLEYSEREKWETILSLLNKHI